MRGEDARYVDNNGDDDQANTRLRGSFFFSLSLLSVPPSRVTLLVTVRLFCANFLFSPPLPLFSSSFFQKKHLLQLHGRFSKGWPDFIPSRCAPSGSAPLEKTLNTLLRASRVPGAAFLSRLFLSPSRGIPCIFPYPRIRRDTPSPPCKRKGSVKGVFLSRKSLIQCLRASRLKRARV